MCVCVCARVCVCVCACVCVCIVSNSQTEDSLHGNVDSRDIKCFKEDFSRFESIFHWVKWCLCE